MIKFFHETNARQKYCKSFESLPKPFMIAFFLCHHNNENFQINPKKSVFLSVVDSGMRCTFRNSKNFFSMYRKKTLRLFFSHMHFLESPVIMMSNLWKKIFEATIPSRKACRKPMKRIKLSMRLSLCDYMRRFWLLSAVFLFS